ncbi:MAG: hypothetical protein PHG25_01395 [Candidatus Pacebacteria bacterium]|nr:hypothetical protein [Candidatus Paceibacterota bacterium]
MVYTTKSIKNLFNGEPFTLDVPPEKMARFEKAMKYAESGGHMFHTKEAFIRMWELSLFPSYQELLKIWFDNGYTPELMAQILRDFGIPNDFAQKLLEDERFIEGLRGWFEGITCDGERASRTLGCVYDAIAGHFSVKEHASTWIH